jgi:ATP-binding cassette subfamily F protein 3
MNFPKPERTGDIVFRTENLAKSFKNTPLFHNAAFTIERGQRWAVIGPNGCGKTTLIRCLLHELSPDEGRVVHGQGVKIGYFDQQLHVLDNDMLVVDAVRPKNKKIMEDLERRKLLGAFGLTGDQQLQTVGSLSGGQRCRAALARLAAEEANVLILDEPTNHLDLWARAALEKAIRDFEGTVLLISHDRYFVDHVADHLLIIQPNGCFRELEGNYTTYRHLVSRGLIADPFVKNADAKKETVQQENFVSSDRNLSKSPGQKLSYRKQSAQKSGGTKHTVQGNQSVKNISSYTTNDQHKNNKHKNPPAREIKYGTHNSVDVEPPEKPFVETCVKPRNAGQKRKRKFSYRKISDIEQEIADHESMAETLESMMLLPETLRDGNRIREITAELNDLRAKLQNLYDHWEEASELN